MERLGGIDFDEALFTRAMALVKSSGVEIDGNDPATLAALARLREECRRAKEALSSDTDATIQIFLPGIQQEMRLTRPEFEEMVRPRIRETIQALERAARSAGLGFADLDRVLLVGGSSRIPLVAEMVREATGKPVAVDAHPKHTMALGAAYIADQGRQSEAGAAVGAIGVAGLAAAGIAGASAAAGVDGPGPPTTPPPPAAIEPEPMPASMPAEPVTVPPDPPADIPPGATGGESNGGRRVSVPMAAILAGIALVAVIAIGGSGLLGGTGGSASPSPSAVSSVAVVATPSPSPSPTPSPSPAPTPSPTPTPTPEPTPSPTPSGRQVRIQGITIEGNAYAVAFEAFHFTPDIPGTRHIHFFWDTIPPTKAGRPAPATNWILYDGSSPFLEYKVKDRPAGAKQMCVLVANHDHTVVQKTGNCWPLPD
jgi:hypothetical protein